MNGRAASSAVAVVALMALILVSASIAAGRSSTNIIAGTKSIDGYRVGAPYAAARRTFGFPKASSQNGTTCTARWMNGVSISWHRTLPYAKWTKACVRFSRARVGKPSVAQRAWRTNEGLRVGARASQVSRLYPSATSRRSGVYTIWTLQKSPKVSLNAWVKKGRVAFFRLAAG